MGETRTPTIITTFERWGVRDTQGGLLPLASIPLPGLWAYLHSLCIFEQEGTLASISVTPYSYTGNSWCLERLRPPGELSFVGAEGGGWGKEGLLLEKLYQEVPHGMWYIWALEVHTDIASVT